jgi:hypothetical protein
MKMASSRPLASAPPFRVFYRNNSRWRARLLCRVHVTRYAADAGAPFLLSLFASCTLSRRHAMAANAGLPSHSLPSLHALSSPTANDLPATTSHSVPCLSSCLPGARNDCTLHVSSARGRALIFTTAGRTSWRHWRRAPFFAPGTRLESRCLVLGRGA